MTNDDELEAELREHVEARAEELVGEGIPLEEARRRAVIELGGIEQVKEDCRDERRGAALEALVQDARYGLRLLRRDPGFAAAVVATLALGIGANTAIFSVASAALLRALPYRDPDRLVRLRETKPGDPDARPGASHPDFLDWRNQTRSFEGVSGYTQGGVRWSGRSGVELLASARVTGEFFDTLGVGAAVGRTFHAGEDAPGADGVAVLSHASFEQRFGGDPSVIGRPVTLSGRPYTVVGVLPRGFHFAPVGPVEVWLPLVPNREQRERRYMHWLRVVARLKEGVSREQASADLEVVARQIERTDPQWHSGHGLVLVPLRDQIVGPVRPILLLLLGCVAFLLLIACANVANLLLARSSARQRETAVRVALGASRGRLLRQHLTESVLLALIGGGLGALWARWGVQVLIGAIPDGLRQSMPFLEQSGVRLEALAFTLVISAATGVLFGLVPALRATRPASAESLKEGIALVAGPRRQRLNGAIVVAETALSVVLLTGAGLMSRSLTRLLHVDPGFRTSNLLTFRVALPPDRYTDDARPLAYFQRLLDELRALPGVTGAAVVDLLPLGGGGNTGILQFPGRPTPESGEGPEAFLRVVSANYFRVMGIPLLKGRAFDERDVAGAPLVALVSRRLAEQAFAGEDPIGQKVNFTFFAGRPPLTVVGVVDDEKVRELDAELGFVFYFPFTQNAETAMNVVLRTATEPLPLAEAARRVARALEPDTLVLNPRTMEQQIEGSNAAFLRSYPRLLMGLFASLGVLLAAIGIYGVMSYSVSQRRREIGLRMALGARRDQIARMVLRRGMRLAVMGISAGLAGAAALSRLMRALLFGVSHTDPGTFAAVAAILAGVAFAAIWVPAVRAMRVQPAVALRHE